MSYCTSSSIFVYLVGYSASDTATTSIVNDSITDAQNEINKYLGERYDVSLWSTLSSTPPLVTTICKWYAAGLAIEACSRGSKEALKRSEVLIKRATANLEGLESGKLSIVDSSGVLVDKDNDPMQVYSSTEDYSNTFNEDDPLRWKVSAQKNLDIISERRE